MVNQSKFLETFVRDVAATVAPPTVNINLIFLIFQKAKNHYCAIRNSKASNPDENSTSAHLYLIAIE